MTLAEFLNLNKLSQADFALRIGTTQAAVSRYVAGRLPRRPQLEAIKAATDGAVTADDFLSESTAA